ncbi:MAG: SUMF1/EgtB/PvdO family nonheme iron enzyme [Planctomycetes bacterium]|nr:SUMF1/EgtB/PvdO family nonheme iron enzyme [Planctomycetota bacterium]
MRTREVSRAEWRAFLQATGASPALLPKGWIGPIEELFRPDLRSEPIFGITRDHARAFVRWLTDELARARVPYVARLPRLAESHRATRGELPWPYPWGRTFDGSFCYCSESSDATQSSGFAADTSPFGLLALAGSRAEFTDDDHEHKSIPRVVVFGGDLGASQAMVHSTVTHRSTAPIEFRDPVVGFRYVLVPRDTPLPDTPPDPARSRPLLRAARDAFRSGDLAGSYRLLTEALDLTPLEPVLWSSRGVLRLQRGDSWGAIWDLTRALDLAPDNAADYRRRAEAHASEHAFAEAVADLDRALALDPSVAEAWAERARWRAQLDEDPAGPIADLQEALRRAPASDLAPTWREHLAQCRAEQARRAAAAARDR